jgi:NADH-quinone oxidoreductase subunit A
MIKIRRIYEPEGPDEHYKVLIDRLWPRGISKEKAGWDEWLKEISPSNELRKWYNHDPAKWNEFKRLYEQSSLLRLKELEITHGTDVLTSTKDEHNHAVALKVLSEHNFVDVVVILVLESELDRFYISGDSILAAFLVYAFAVLVIVGIMLGLSHILGERHKEKLTDEPFESGISPTGNARLRFSSHFYLIAIFFVIFDLDAVFILVWAISFRELGIGGYIGILVFIGILIVASIVELKRLTSDQRGN